MTTQCEKCNGNGGSYFMSYDGDGDDWIECSECEGLGYYYLSPEDDPSLIA